MCLLVCLRKLLENSFLFLISLVNEILLQHRFLVVIPGTLTRVVVLLSYYEGHSAWYLQNRLWKDTGQGE